ncbi:spore cortex biosynthesis protein YabQ [Angelakisella massiliensis]|uniref:spore cortex biosynthesis protein YabQ n=1 Tax=Angelakisella massiliensis TaxID=1871018 RepID=UPI0008F8E37F|nr:spore cortex biosynthesis protein YabQ [Angelakisella massiliensis]
MGFTLAQQTQQFLGALALGILLGMGYDLFRVSRRMFHLSAAAVFGEDLCFFLLAGIVLLVYLTDHCYGEVRGFVVTGAALSFFLYNVTISSFVVKAACGLVYGLIKIVMFLLRPIVWLSEYGERCVGKLKKILLQAFGRGKSFLQLQAAMLYNKKDHNIKGKAGKRHGSENL